MTFVDRDPDWSAPLIVLAVCGGYAALLLIRYGWVRLGLWADTNVDRSVTDAIGPSKILQLDDHAETVTWVNEDRPLPGVDFVLWQAEMEDAS